MLDGITGYHLAEPMSSDSIINDINRALADKERHQIAEKAKSLVFFKIQLGKCSAAFRGTNEKLV